MCWTFRCEAQGPFLRCWLATAPFFSACVPSESKPRWALPLSANSALGSAQQAWERLQVGAQDSQTAHAHAHAHCPPLGPVLQDFPGPWSPRQLLARERLLGMSWAVWELLLLRGLRAGIPPAFGRGAPSQVQCQALLPQSWSILLSDLQEKLSRKAPVGIIIPESRETVRTAQSPMSGTLSELCPSAGHLAPLTFEVGELEYVFQHV